LIAFAYGFLWSSEVAKAAATGTSGNACELFQSSRNPQILNLEPFAEQTLGLAVSNDHPTAS
jgi:hypothetical protein